MRIHVKSWPENFEKEKSGQKPNTVRKLDGKDILVIENTKTGEKIERIISDITEWEGALIISFKGGLR